MYSLDSHTHHTHSSLFHNHDTHTHTHTHAHKHAHMHNTLSHTCTILSRLLDGYTHTHTSSQATSSEITRLFSCAYHLRVCVCVCVVVLCCSVISSGCTLILTDISISIPLFTSFYAYNTQTSFKFGQNTQRGCEMSSNWTQQT